MDDAEPQSILNWRCKVFHTIGALEKKNFRISAIDLAITAGAAAVLDVFGGERRIEQIVKENMNRVTKAAAKRCLLSTAPVTRFGLR